MSAWNGFPAMSVRTTESEYQNVTGVLDPWGVVTTTSTGPAACAGDVTVNDVSDPTDSDVPATPSNVAPVAPVNAEPVNVTDVPPPSPPYTGEMAVTVAGLELSGDPNQFQ